MRDRHGSPSLRHNEAAWSIGGLLRHHDQNRVEVFGDRVAGPRNHAKGLGGQRLPGPFNFVYRDDIQHPSNNS